MTKVMAGGPHAVPGCSEEAGIDETEVTDGSGARHPRERSRRQDQGGGVRLQGASHLPFPSSSPAYCELRELRGF